MESGIHTALSIMAYQAVSDKLLNVIFHESERRLHRSAGGGRKKPVINRTGNEHRHTLLGGSLLSQNYT
jgi:hypothetical protein